MTHTCTLASLFHSFPNARKDSCLASEGSYSEDMCYQASVLTIEKHPLCVDLCVACQRNLHDIIIKGGAGRQRTDPAFLRDYQCHSNAGHSLNLWDAGQIIKMQCEP